MAGLGFPGVHNYYVVTEIIISHQLNVAYYLKLIIAD